MPSCSPTAPMTRTPCADPEQGAVPNIPSKRNRRWKACFSRVLYRDRNAIERMFCRLKDYRRISTRYDKLATNFLAAIHLAAVVCYCYRFEA